MRRIAATPEPYLIFYEPVGGEVVVIGVRHGARDPVHDAGPRLSDRSNIYSGRCSRRASTPTMPSRKASTQTTKTAPSTTVTQEPMEER